MLKFIQYNQHKFPITVHPFDIKLKLKNAKIKNSFKNTRETFISKNFEYETETGTACTYRESAVQFWSKHATAILMHLDICI